MEYEIGEGGAIIIKLHFEFEDQKYELDGHALPVEGFEKPEIGKDAIPVSIEFDFRDQKYKIYKLLKKAKLIP